MAVRPPSKSIAEYQAELKALGEEMYNHSLELVRLKRELEIANREQESLLHFISHEVKGYLTKSEAAFASITEGDYGHIPEKLKTMSWAALSEVRKGVATVMDILEATNFKKGTVAYAKKKFDLRAAIRDVVSQLEPTASEKGLSIELSIGEGEFLFEGDEDKLKRHVIRNLIDNAIKYTPRGVVKVVLTDGGHGKDSIKTNVHSTGYGLYIAKKIVEAHGGKIWAKSDGQDKGARFVVELPLT